MEVSLEVVLLLLESSHKPVLVWNGKIDRKIMIMMLMMMYVNFFPFKYYFFKLKLSCFQLGVLVNIIFHNFLEPEQIPHFELIGN